MRLKVFENEQKLKALTKQSSNIYTNSLILLTS